MVSVSEAAPAAQTTRLAICADMRLLFADYETRSGADIGSVGLYKYMEDADFKPLLLAYAFDDAETQLIDFTIGEDYPDEFLDALNDPEVLLVGQNLQFERNVLRVHRGIEFPAERCIDTMTLAASCGLPLSLAQICEALGMSEDKAKMKAGAALIRKFCCPRKPTKKNPKLWVDPDDAPEDWDTFCRYCIRDVDSERDVYRTLAHWMYPPEEVRFYALDSRINEKGVKSDIALARNAMDMDARYKAELTKKAIVLTNMANPSSVAQVKAWLLEQEGMEVPTLNKKAVAGVVEALQTDKAKEFMAIRTELSKTSTKKYDAFIRCACSDDHIRGCFQFFGGHTGRFAGRLVQLQNLSQNHMEDLDDAREIVKDGDYDFLRAVYPSVTNTLSELTRTTLIPEEGHKFCVADFSAIEARVSAWLTGEEWVLDSFRAGKDIYCATASQMFGVPVEKHGQNAELRQKGKIATLACGYGGGVNSLIAFGADRMGLSNEEMAGIIDAWRSANPHISASWKSIQNAVVRCITRKATVIDKVCGVRFRWDRGIMWMLLPSGREMAYYHPEYGPSEFNKDEMTISYMGMNQTKHKWQRIETRGSRIFENLVQATARDILREAMFSLDENGWDIRAHVHDEVICTEPLTGRSVDDMARLMCPDIPWAKGLPLRADGYECSSYRKD